MQSALAEKCPDNAPIILAGAGRDQCGERCNSDRQSCVDRCPGFDESNVVDPKYAARKCKAACDAVLSECKSGCPNDCPQAEEGRTCEVVQIMQYARLGADIHNASPNRD